MIRDLNQTEKFLEQMTRPFTIQLLEDKINSRRAMEEGNTTSDIGTTEIGNTERPYPNGTSRLIGEVTALFYEEYSEHDDFA